MGGVAVLVLILAAVWIVGSTLPVAHSASVSRVIEADVEAVWARIDAVPEWPSWQEMTVQALGPDSVRIRQHGETIEYRLQRPEPRTLVTRIASPDLPFGGRWTWTARAVGEGSTEVTVVEDGEVYDPFFRFFSRFVFGHESSIRAALDALEASFS